jgi:hypothetical protein
MMFNSVEEALKACKSAGYDPRHDVSGLGEDRFYVWLPGTDSPAALCYWGKSQFLGWANVHFARLAAEQKRREAGWELLLDPEESPSGFLGWHAPCGTHEDAWRSLGRPMPEDRRELSKVFF